MTAQVTVVIACHSAERPLDRAVRSVLEGNERHARPLVVAHNISPEELSLSIAEDLRPHVQILHHKDGISSPTGPFNAGLEAVETPWCAVMGSDDWLEPGAVQSWLRLAKRYNAEAVLTNLALGSPTRTVPTPPARVLHRGLRHERADRLVYRSAPLGLLSTSTLERLELKFIPGLSVGEDVAFATRLACEARVAVDRTGPAYVIGEDAGDRVTYVVRPIREQLAFIPPLIASPWFNRLAPSTRAAIIVKFIRIHVFGTVHYRPGVESWSGSDREDLASLCQRLLNASPSAVRSFSRAEASLLAACLDPTVDAASLAELSRKRRHHGTPATLVTSRVGDLFLPDAPPRFIAASAATKLTGTVAAALRSYKRPS